MKDENFMILYALIIIGLLIALCGCNSVKYVPVKEVHTEYITQHDTIRQSDSIIREQTTIIREADSTLLARLGMWTPSHEKIFVIEKESHEKSATASEKVKGREVLKTDTIQVPYPVEKKLSRWQRFCCDYGKLMLGATIVCIIALSFLLIRYIKRKMP